MTEIVVESDTVWWCYSRTDVPAWVFPVSWRRATSMHQWKVAVWRRQRLWRLQRRGSRNMPSQPSVAQCILFYTESLNLPTLFISRVALYQASVSGLCDGTYRSVCLSVWRFVCLQIVLWQNGWVDPDTVWDGEWVWSRNGCIRCGGNRRRGRSSFGVNFGRPGVVVSKHHSWATFWGVWTKTLKFKLDLDFFNNAPRPTNQVSPSYV